MKRKTLIYSVTGTVAAMMLSMMVFAGGDFQNRKEEPEAQASISSQMSHLLGSEGGYLSANGGPTITAVNGTGLDLVVQASQYSPYENIAISQVSDYVNIRSEANTTSEILGKIYNNSAATILETVDGEGGQWYYIESGSVKGYMKAEYFVTGDEAEAVAKEVGAVIATTKAETLRLREEPSTESRILTLLDEGEEYQVKEEGFIAVDGTEFVKVDLGEGDDGSSFEGYVAVDYIEIRVEFKEAISIEEERAAIEEQKRLQREAEAARQRAAQAQAAAKKQQASQQVIPPNVSSSLRDAIVAYAMQFKGNPYRYGGTSLTNGTDCSGFTSSVYRDCGVSIPRTSRQQAAGGTEISASQLKVGDLVFYASRGTIDHVALYIGNGQILHAASTRTGIIVSSMYYRTPCKYVTYLN